MGRFHVRSQPIWQESAKRMKRETFCSCLLAPVGTASISKSFILLELPVATSNQIVWQMITKRAQGRSDPRAPLYVQLSAVCRAIPHSKGMEKLKKELIELRKGLTGKMTATLQRPFLLLPPPPTSSKTDASNSSNF